MKILAMEIETPGSEDEDFRPYMKPEARRAWELHQAGVIRELYFRQDRRTALLVLEFATLEEARQALVKKRYHLGRFPLDWKPTTHLDPSPKGQPNKWITFYAYLALKECGAIR